MNTFDADDILSGLEAYIESLPPTRRRKRTHEEIYNPDQSPEVENYDKLSLWDALTGATGRSAGDEPARALLLAWEIQGRFAMVYRLAARQPEAKAANAALPDLVKQLAAMAGGCDSEEVIDRAVDIFHTLEWERQQPILLGATGRYYATEAYWRQERNKRQGGM